MCLLATRTAANVDGGGLRNPQFSVEGFDAYENGDAAVGRRVVVPVAAAAAAPAVAATCDRRLKRVFTLRNAVLLIGVLGSLVSLFVMITAGHLSVKILHSPSKIYYCTIGISALLYAITNMFMIVSIVKNVYFPMRLDPLNDTVAQQHEDRVYGAKEECLFLVIWLTATGLFLGAFNTIVLYECSWREFAKSLAITAFALACMCCVFAYYRRRRRDERESRELGIAAAYAQYALGDILHI